MTSHRQIKTGDISNFRRQFAVQQRYACPICSGTLATGLIALDHCHNTGMLRATLCGLCNRNEGKVLKAMRYMAKKEHPVWHDPIAWLRNLADYLEYHQNNPSGLVHPTFDMAKGKQKPKKRPKRKPK